MNVIYAIWPNLSITEGSRRWKYFWKIFWYFM